MKTLVSALALLVGSNFMALAADQTLKFKLVTFYIGEKDGESHMVGATVSPDGTIGTKDFYNKQGENGASSGHSTYYFPNGSLVANYSVTSTGTQTGGHILGKYQIISGTDAYQGATGSGSFEGDWGDKSPLKGAELYNVELDVKTSGSEASPAAAGGPQIARRVWFSKDAPPGRSASTRAADGAGSMYIYIYIESYL